MAHPIQKYLPALCACLICLLLAFPQAAGAQADAAQERPSQASLSSEAESLRTSLLDAQLRLSGDTQGAQAAFAAARSVYDRTFAPPFAATAASSAERIRAGFAAGERSLAAADAQGLAAARAAIWTGVLDGAYKTLLSAIAESDAATAQRWLQVREFSQATRLARPGADATLALRALADGAVDPAYVRQAVHADLLDAYQDRLAAALQNVASADARGFSMRRAEAAAAAQGYFAILSQSYTEQRGATAAGQVERQLAALSAVTAKSDPATSDPHPKSLVAEPLGAVEAALDGFRAAPLSPTEQARRAAQLLRFLALVPIEYGRGVNGEIVTNDLEIGEALAFAEAASGAFADLQPDLHGLDPAATAAADGALSALHAMLAATATREAVAPPPDVEAATEDLLARLQTLLPSAWQQHNSAADFDLIAAALGQMQTAVVAGDYERADASRLEAYALLESGPEARLVAFAPESIAPLEGLFWYGEGDNPGLASLLGRNAPAAEVSAARALLDKQLLAAEAALSGEASPTALAINAAIIVFREGLEAVVILAALTASMVGARRVYRRPMALGVALAFVASALTWWLMQTVLSAFRGYGERLEAVVSLVAIGVLLLITNWFFHRVYWTDWMADLHSRKKSLLGGAFAGQMVGFLTLGFTSVYREGFETVLFLQALVLDAGLWPILQGTALGLLCVFAIGWLTFKLQSRLPYKRMLVGTGVLIGVVLLVMVGNTVHVLQVVGWLPVHPIRWLVMPYWMGMWFGVYATWEGLALQAAAGAFVIGSYVAAEAISKRTPHRLAAHAGGQGAPAGGHVGGDAAKSGPLGTDTPTPGIPATASLANAER